MMIKKISLMAVVVALLVSAIYMPLPAKSIAVDCNDPRLSLNDIQFWNPCDSECIDSTSSIAIPDAAGAGRNERLRMVIHKYGEHAMEMQREWGTPWELVFAQMVMESGVGTAGIAVTGATNNWLGIKGTGDAGTIGGNAIFSSIEASITAWAGTYVLRNGMYDHAYPYTDPNNYDIKRFFAEMVEVYAPTSDGNDTTEYKSVIYGLLEGPVKEAREEKNWPSSAELAKKENIPIGGRHPIGSDTSGGAASTTTTTSTECYSSNGAVQGEIVQTAINISWPDRSHGLYDPKPEYVDALEKAGLTNAGCGPNGADCGVFVATVMRSSGVDEDYPIGTSYQMQYLRENSDKYQALNTESTEGLQPGDIFVNNQHTMMYVGDVATDGGQDNASASCTDRIADRGTKIYFTNGAGRFEKYRHK